MADSPGRFVAAGDSLWRYRGERRAAGPPRLAFPAPVSDFGRFASLVKVRYWTRPLSATVLFIRIATNGDPPF